MRLAPKQYAKILYAIDMHKGDIEKGAREFVALLARDGMLSKSRDIFAEFLRLRKEKENLVEVVVESARELQETERREIVSAVEKKFSKKAEASWIVNPAVISGVKIRVDDTLIDSTAQTKLKHLKKIITK